jgi:hypothetical protein
MCETVSASPGLNFTKMCCWGIYPRFFYSRNKDFRYHAMITVLSLYILSTFQCYLGLTSFGDLFGAVKVSDLFGRLWNEQLGGANNGDEFDQHGQPGVDVQDSRPIEGDRRAVGAG